VYPESELVWQVTQYLAETRAGLLAMVQLTQAQDDILVQVGSALDNGLTACPPPAPDTLRLQLRLAAGARYDSPDAGAGGRPLVSGVPWLGWEVHNPLQETSRVYPNGAQ
jgi:hypothetical protein